jgi:hypothetical protein
VIVVPKEAALAEGAEVLIVAQTEVAAPLTNDRATAVWNALTELGRWAESQPSELPEDLARQHDHYLHGLPKRP